MSINGKRSYERYLNTMEPPEHDHPANGGRVPWGMVDNYGTWLRRNDPIAFEVGYGEWRRGE